ncbi:hypothetical protein PUN28_008166 [Cardiocondyla obscurior]|uniref:Uncharacterized protein n=1 Tax=Cardiocondyla obscurior TaxID=286306 RepID=A0AAW2FYP6_9HYME
MSATFVSRNISIEITSVRVVVTKNLIYNIIYRVGRLLRGWHNLISREGYAKYRYLLRFVNVAKTLKLVPCGFFVRKLAEIVELEGPARVIGLLNGVPPAFLHLTTKHHRRKYFCGKKTGRSAGRRDVYTFDTLR